MPDVTTTHVLEVHLEELGQRSWWKALLNTLSGSNGSAQFRFVARPPQGSPGPRVKGATFPVMRFQDLDDQTEPNAWLELARDSWDDLDRRLVAGGWARTANDGPHWWSRTYERTD
jgi:hypothetical protein